ncbi:MAG: acyl carrier protein [Burkholderiaceae bacterium]|nr:acyl carrier protein [Burkholderiaceae bacterium]
MNTREALAWIAEVFEEPPGNVAADTARGRIPGWDSLGTLTLIAALDERFDIHLSEADMNGMQQVKDILEILRHNGVLQDA